MKIEKVNDHQIRCTLTREDLANREIKISELAYGTDKAKSLFKEMMDQAAYECGFEAEDIPLMIEAIPLNAECIVLIITKVEDPEELDTRFSKFAPSVHDEEDFDFDDMPETLSDGADEVLNLLRKMSGSSEDHTQDIFRPEALSSATPKTNRKPNVNAKSADSVPDMLFAFSSLHEVSALANIIAGLYTARNTLYKDNQTGRYLLLLNMSDADAVSFNKVYNICSEYGSAQKTSSATTAYLKEHYEPIIADRAIQVLSEI